MRAEEDGVSVDDCLSTNQNMLQAGNFAYRDALKHRHRAETTEDRGREC